MTIQLGHWVAATLAGSWRSQATPAATTHEQLAEIYPLLVEGGAGGLAWWRLRSSRLRNTQAGRALRHAYVAQALSIELSEQILADALGRLRAAGVEPILLKGWTAARLYPDPALRPYGDFDLCVDPRQLASAEGVLTQANGKLIAVELHEGVPDLPDRTWSEIVQRSRLLPLGDTNVRTLGPEDMLRQLSCHFWRHSALRPLWLCDIAAALEQLPADFDWSYFQRGEPCAVKWTLCFLGLACRLLGAKTNAPEIERAAANLPPWVVANVLWRWGTGMRRVTAFDLLRHPLQLFGTVRHQWLNRMTIACRSNLPPEHSWALVLASALLQQPIKLAIRVRRIAETRFRNWAGRPEAPYCLHLSDTSKYL